MGGTRRGALQPLTAAAAMDAEARCKEGGAVHLWHRKSILVSHFPSTTVQVFFHQCFLSLRKMDWSGLKKDPIISFSHMLNLL